MNTLLLVALLPLSPSPQEPLALAAGAHVCLIGNTLAERMQHDGALETQLHARHPAHRLVVRNLAFSGDEIGTRLRSRGFGTPDDHLARQRANVILAFFGYGESFGGAEGLARFQSELTSFIEHTGKQKYDTQSAPELVLFSPIAHEDLDDPHLPDGRDNNARLELYTDAMAEVAREHDVRFVDLFRPTRQLYTAHDEPLTINGIHLNRRGNELVADVIATELFGPAPSSDPTRDVALRQAVLDKNFHWFHHYRTTDGYSIFGGRGGLAFVDGQTNRDVAERELEVLDAMTRNRDQRIWATAQGRDLEVDDSDTLPFLTVVTNKPGEGPGGQHVFLGGEAAIERMTVADGMAVGLFASEERFPELVNPVQVAVDPRGRLWVATWPGYPHWQPKTEMNDKLLILPDEDRDGRADRCIVFADGLTNPTGFEFYGRGVFVAQAPDLLYLEDTDGDDRADVRVRVLHGLDSADTHHTANSFVLDPGGALYFQEGTFHHTQVETPHGPNVRAANGAVYRYEPRTGRFEVYASYGFANPHGHVFDRWGQDFVTDGTGAVPYFGTSFSGHVEFPRKHGAAPPVYQQRTRPCGATEILSSAHFPEANQGSYLVTNVIGFQGILQYRLLDDGSGFEGVEVEPIVYSTDPNFRPVDLEVGGDGALYFADWQNPIIGHMQHNLRDPSRDVTHGRIYRVTCPDRPLSPPATIAGRPIPDLLALLESPENRVRYRARIELGARPTTAVVAELPPWMAALDTRDPDHEHHLMEALWVHQHHHSVNEELLRRMLRSPDARARAAATRVLCAWRHDLADPLALLAPQTDDENPRVRLEAVRACSFFASAAAAEIALAATRHPTDRYLDYTLAETMRTLEPYWRAAIVSGEPFPAANPDGARYLLQRVGDDELVHMARSEGVCRALLERPSIAASHRREALDGLASARSTHPLDELIDAIESQAASPRASSDDLQRLLVEWSAEDLVSRRDRLVALATGGAAASARAGAWAALIVADASGQRTWQQASGSAQAAVDWLSGIRWIANDELRGSLYSLVRPLLFELPDELADAVDRANEGQRPGVRFALYHEPGFPDVAQVTLDRLRPVADGEVSTFTLDVPGRRPDGFAVKLSATLLAPAAGEYTFYLRSDDGSRLYVDDEEVIDNDGLHGTRERSESIALSRGPHRIVVTYYDNAGAEALDVAWEGPGITRQDIPAGALFLDDGQDIQRMAVLALGHLPGDDAQKFADLAALIRSGDRRDAAIESMLRIPATARPRAEAMALARDFPAIAAETPFAMRNAAPYEQTLDLGRQLAMTLPAAEGAELRRSLENLELIVVKIGAVPGLMRWDVERFTVVAGKPVKIVFDNQDAMPHNLLISTPGSLQEIGAAADKMATDPKGFEKAFVPESEKVLWTSKLVYANQKAELDFVAPDKSGDYPYICTFPGHWRSMNGVMRVVEER